MPFAGRLRLSTFVAGLAGCAVGVLGLGVASTVVLPAMGFVLWESTAPSPVERPFEPAPSAVAAAPPVAPIVAAPASAAVVDVAAPSSPSARDVDAIVLSYTGKDLGSDKRKDVTAGAPYKVNVYQDAGNATANRAKIDLDRDEKWDEKVTFEAGRITRQVAPADDENYTQTFHWVDGVWKPE